MIDFKIDCSIPLKGKVCCRDCEHFRMLPTVEYGVDAKVCAINPDRLVSKNYESECPDYKKDPFRPTTITER